VATILSLIAYMARAMHAFLVMYGRILRQLRESKSRSQAEVARRVGISPAQMARLEGNQRGLYLEDFVNIAEALGEKPGNLLPNDLGDIAHLKPVIDRLAGVRPEYLARVAAIIGKIVLLTEDVTAAKRLPGQPQDDKPRRKLRSTPRKGRP
jgi:transcriptional regulator with XRE-family HTH domain